MDEVLQRAKDALSGFHLWLVKVGGYSDYDADMIVAQVVAAIWASSAKEGEEPDPAEILHDSRISRPSFSAIKSSLKKYYTWQLCRRSSTATQKRQAQTQLKRIGSVSPTGRPINPKPTERRVEFPLPPAQFRKLLRHLPKWYKKHRLTWPWSLAVLGMKFKLGVPGASLLYLHREDLVLALAEGRKCGCFSLYARRMKSGRVFTIPIGMVWQEAETLVNWPWEWRVLGDLISPSDPSVRHQRAVTILSTASGSFLSAAFPGVDRGAESFHVQVKYAAWVWMLKQLKGDWFSLAAITGMPKLRLMKIPALLAVVSDED